MASLYDDIDQLDSKTSGGTSIPSADTNKINLTFLKSQLEAKKAMLQRTHKLSSVPPNKSISAPTINLSLNQEKPKSLLNLKPRRAAPVDSTSTFTIVPKSLKEDKVFLFGEVLIGKFTSMQRMYSTKSSEDEYNPTAPTDYATYKHKRDVQRAKERAAKEVAERLQRQVEEEDMKRKTGAAIAPPKELADDDSPTIISQSPINFEPPSQFGKSGSRGLGVAANIMQRFGYQEGSGLGRFGQGISQALKVERTGRNLGLIVNREGPEESTNKRFKQDPESIEENPQQNITETLKSATKIVLLLNMVHPSDIDSQLEEEIREEMKKYGKLTNVIVHQMPNKPDDEAVRIFIEFSNQAQAIKAFVGINGRLFGGRTVRASFYSLDEFAQRKLNSNV